MKVLLTCDGAEEPEGGSFTRVLIDHALAGGLRHRDGKGDGLVELAPAWLHCHDGGNSYSVTQEFGNQVSRYWLSLEQSY